MTVAGRTLDWSQVLGLSYVCIGLSLLPAAATASLEGRLAIATTVQLVAGGIGGLLLVLIGLDITRGGRHFDLSYLG